MNPFDTPDTTAPIASPIPSNAPATINIDTMLANLSQQSAVSSTAPSPTMQLSSLDKPIPSITTPPLSESKSFWIPGWLKKIFSLIATIILVIVGYRFISVQYPLETKGFVTSIVGSFQRIIAIIEKNQDSSFMTGSALILSTGDTLIGGGDDFVATPLSDAIAEASSGSVMPSSSEQVRDMVLSGTSTDTGSVYLSGSTLSGSAMIDTIDQTIVHAVASSDAERREGARKTLLAMKGVLDQKLVDLTLSNNNFHLSLVKVALKNIDLTLALSEQASDSEAWDEVDAKIQSIQSIYDRLEDL